MILWHDEHHFYHLMVLKNDIIQLFKRYMWQLRGM